MARKPPVPAPRAHPKPGDPEWYGDTLGAIHQAKAAGYKHIDQNFTWVYDRDIPKRTKPGDFAGRAHAIHSDTARKNDVTHIVDANSGRIRRMTNAELDGEVNVHVFGPEIDRWRRPGRSEMNGYRIHSLHRHAQEWVEVGIDGVPEQKNKPFGHVEVARQCIEAMTSAGHRAVAMALWGLPWCRQKCSAWMRAAKQLGVTAYFAVIYGASQNKRKAAHKRIDKWAVQPTWD